MCVGLVHKALLSQRCKTKVQDKGASQTKTVERLGTEHALGHHAEMTSDLCGEVRTAVDVCVEYMGKENLGEVGNPVERISTLLAPRRKTLSKQECVNGSPDVKQLAIN